MICVRLLPQTLLLPLALLVEVQELLLRMALQPCHLLLLAVLQLLVERVLLLLQLLRLRLEVQGSGAQEALSQKLLQRLPVVHELLLLLLQGALELQAAVC